MSGEDDLKWDIQTLLADGPVAVVGKLDGEFGPKQRHVFVKKYTTVDGVLNAVRRAESRGATNLYLIRNPWLKLVSARRKFSESWA